MTRELDVAAARIVNEQAAGDVLSVGGVWDWFEWTPALGSLTVLDLSARMLDAYCPHGGVRMEGDLFDVEFPPARLRHRGLPARPPSHAARRLADLAGPGQGCVRPRPSMAASRRPGRHHRVLLAVDLGRRPTGRPACHEAISSSLRTTTRRDVHPTVLRGGARRAVPHDRRRGRRSRKASTTGSGIPSSWGSVGCASRWPSTRDCMYRPRCERDWQTRIRRPRAERRTATTAPAAEQ